MIEQKLIGDIVKQHPDVSEVFDLEKYFGGSCLKRPGFKVHTLEMACILLGMDHQRLLREKKESRIER